MSLLLKRKSSVFQMKKILLASAAALSLNLAGENFFPNGTFEGDWRPVWNRLNTENYTAGTPGWSLVKGHDGNCLAADGSGKALELQFEAPSRVGVISLELKGEKPSQSVTVMLNSYNGLNPLVLFRKSFKVTSKVERISFKLPSDNRMRYRLMAPYKLTITPAKGDKITVDNVKFEGPYKPYLAKFKKSVPVPVVVTAGAPLKESVPFTVKHYGESTDKVPFTVVLPFASGAFASASDWVGVQVKDEKGKLYPAQGRIISRWPGNNSVRALAVDAVGALKKGVNKMTAVPGKVDTVPLQGKCKITLRAADGDGTPYQGAFEGGDVEIAGPVRTVVSGWTELKAPGKVSLPVQCRMSFFKGIPDVAIEVSLWNPWENKPIVLRNAYAEFDSGAKVKHYAQSLALREKGKPSPALPHFVQGSAALIMPQIAERHPAELTARNGKYAIALWPDSVKQLSMSITSVLTRSFIWSPDKEAVKRFGAERTVAMAEPARYGETRFFLLPLGTVDRKNYPFAAAKIDATFQFRYSKAGQVKAGQDGLFDYGDLPGDGGWSNLESFRDYAELMRAVVCGDHDLLNFAYDRAIHYRDIDTFRGDSLYHSGNHVGGGFSYSHSWPQGIIYHYLMTGDPRSRAVVEEAAKAYLSIAVDAGDIKGARSLSRYLLGLADFYGALGDKALKERFYRQVKHAEKTNLTPANVDATIFPWNGARLDPYQVWYGCCAFMEMYFLSGDKVLLDWFRREMKSSMNMDFYELDLKEQWPGLPPAEGYPIQLGFNSRHRGSLIYPNLVFLSQIDNKPELITLAQKTAYADWCAGAGYGGDSLEYFRLCVLTGGIPEKQLIHSAKEMIFNAAAPKLLNGDFSHSPKWFTYWNLHGLRQMGYDNAIDEWPLVKEKNFKALNQVRMERFANRVSPWRYYARLLGYLDNETYGKAAPALRMQLSSGWALGRTAVVGGACVQMTPGKWKWSFSYKADKALSKQSFCRLTLFEPGKANQFPTISLDPSIKADVKDIGPVKGSYTNRKVSIKDGAKPGWKDLEFSFDLPRASVARPMFYLYLDPGHKEAFVWFDDIKLEKLSGK